MWVKLAKSPLGSRWTSKGLSKCGKFQIYRNDSTNRLFAKHIESGDWFKLVSSKGAKQC